MNNCPKWYLLPSLAPPWTNLKIALEIKLFCNTPQVIL